MGRRALSPVDPNVDLQRHFRTIEQYDCSYDLASWFDEPGPLEIEIGSGKGLFLQSAAATRPDHRFVGVEIARKYARFAAFRLARDGAQNALMVHADATRLITNSIADRVAHAVHVYFPDPWWKARHRKRRVMREDFVPQIERILEPGGRLHFWTDVQEYYQETLTLLADNTSLAGPHDVPEATPNHDLDYRTHFERRMRQHDKPIYRAEFIRDLE